MAGVATIATYPFWQRGTLRLLAVITQGAVIHKSLRPLTLAADPPSLAPAGARCVGDGFGRSATRAAIAASQSGPSPPAAVLSSFSSATMRWAASA